MSNNELNVGGFSVGGRDLMDPELTGSNVRDRKTGQFHDKAPVSRIADAIRTGSSAQTEAGSTGAVVSSKAASIMMQNMQPIMKQLQELSDAKPEFAEEIKKLLDIFKDSHKYNAKEFSEKSVEIIKQIERIKLSAGNDETAQDLAQQLTAGIGDEVKSEKSFGGIKGKVREAFNVDAGIGFKEQVKQAFSMERMFGAKGGFGAAEAQARGDYEREQQSKSMGLSLGGEGLQITEPVAKESIVKGKVAKAGGGIFSGGIDRESQAEQQTETLKEILSVLEQIRDGGGAGGEDGGGGGFPFKLKSLFGGKTTTPTPKKTSLMQRMKSKVGLGPKAGPGLAVADDAAKLGTVADDVAKAGTAVKPGMGGKALNVLGKAAVPLAVGASLYEGYQGFNEADQLVESGEINKETGQAFTEQDETAGKTEAVAGAAGGLAGGLGGAKAGALAGAALGSFVPGIGTVVGGAVGGLIGGAAGYFGGKALGEGLGDAATTTSGEAALEAAEDSGLYDKDMLGNSEIDPEILAVTEDTAQLQAIIADDDLSGEDMEMVKARLAELGGGEEKKPKSEYERITNREAREDTLMKNPGGAVDEEGNLLPQKRGREIPTQGQNIRQAESQTGNMVAEASDGAGEQAASPTVINNVTNNNGGGGAPQLNMTPIQVRPASSTIQRYQDSRYGG